MNRFVLLDRDGVLVRDTDYPHRPEDYALLPGTIAALRRLADAGYAFAIVTNQSGIGRGYYDEAAFRRFQQLLLDDLAAGGVEIAATFHCPHRPDEGCGCRKPAPGLLYQARDALGWPLSDTWLIGDHVRDTEAAQAAGCRGAILLAPPGSAVPEGVIRCDDLAAAAGYILARDRTPAA